MKSTLKGLISFLILVIPSVVVPTESTAQATPAAKPVKSSTLSPAERRAFVRDSLRQERLQSRVTTQASQLPSTPANHPLNTAIDNGNVTSPTQPTTIPETTAKPTLTPTVPTVTTAVPTPESVITEPLATQMELPISDTLMVKSLNVRNTEIRDVLQGLGIQFGVNIVVAPDVTGPITVNFNKIKLKQALRLIAEENGFQLLVVHGAIKVEKRPAPKPLAPPLPRFAIQFVDGKLTVDLQKIPADQVTRKLVEATGRNILLEPEASGDMSAFFKEVELQKGLKMLAETNGLSIREKDGVFSFYREAWHSTGKDGAQTAMSRGRVTVRDKLVTMEVVNSPLGDIVSSISSQSGVGTVVYGDLKGNVTMRVNDVPLEQAFQILFRGTDFTFWVHSGIYFIGPQSMQVLNNSKLIVLKHLKVDDVMELLPAVLSKDAQLKAVKSQNAIMAMGTYEVIDGLAQYIAQIDLPVPQILIEALVVDVDMDKIRQYGVDLFLGDYTKVTSSEHLYPNFDQVLNKQRSQSVVDAIPGIRDIVSLPKNFVAQVQAMEQEKVLKIKSRPQIATLNGSEATITVGQTQYFLLNSETDYSQVAGVASKTTQHFEKIDANVTLTVTPFVTGQGEITCDIVPDFSEPEGSFDSKTPPTLNRRILKSKVRLRDGETIVLGGLVKESVNRTSRQVPFLGSIPILGWLFKNYNSVTSRSQLMIFVTPHVYYGKDANVDPAKYIKKQSDLD
jgi:type II secretory pathway component GspD/PulD (secretin)